MRCSCVRGDIGEMRCTERTEIGMMLWVHEFYMVIDPDPGRPSDVPVPYLYQALEFKLGAELTWTRRKLRGGETDPPPRFKYLCRNDISATMTHFMFTYFLSFSYRQHPRSSVSINAATISSKYGIIYFHRCSPQQQMCINSLTGSWFCL